ncbi:MAG: hypothetical protein HY073_01700, partial [Deltaproteobacteria bacterium]|nr:hypothetical protein [Deltaproteobacteria bacterium]
FGGKGTKKLERKQDNYFDLLNEITHQETQPIMLQTFIPKVSEGEKRVFLIDGLPLGALLKIPAPGSFLTNPDLGGRIVPSTLTRQEKKVCQEVGAFLKKQKVFFAGLDLIDQQLTEINITSPGLLWEWNEIDNSHHEREIIDQIEKKIGVKK